MTTLISKEPGLPPHAYSGHVERVLSRPNTARPRWWLILAGVAVSLLWLWACAYSGLFG